MFTVKLATGEAFPATAAEQNCSGLDAAGAARLTLRLEEVPASHSLGWYQERVCAPGAINTVEVLAEGGAPGLEAEAYTEVVGISLRLLATGERALSVTLCKAGPAQGAAL